MEVAECTKILSSRIQKLEPENFTKIIGCLLLSYDEQQIIKFAYAPDEVIHGLIVESMMFLSSARKPNNFNILAASPPFSGQFSSPSGLLGGGAPYSDYPFANDRQPLNCHPLMQADILNLEEQLHSMKLSGADYSSNYYHPEMALGGGLGLGQAAGQRARSPPNVPEFPSRACHYFYRGFCRHGINCRYSHGPPGPDDFSMLHGVDMHEPGLDDHVFELESLEKLEMEIIELLRARRGMPVSIAALPMIYHERYGKTLQAEGYLTESQRHGKTGISLTRLLARLKNVRLIDRPHGQHSVVLTEDVPKYVDYRTERDDMGVVLSSSNQIYLTFPAESTFTEEDIASYFKRYGPVCDVRVPRQERRMFGFVTFLYPETVRLILSKGHPHYICGARVLVKPYKEKTRSNDKRYAEKMETPMYHPNNYPLIDPELNSFARVHESPSLLQQQLIEDRKQALEYERRRLCDMWLSAKSQNMVLYPDNRLNELNIPEDHSNSLPALKISSPDDEKRTHSSNSSEKDSPYKLPESPFSHPR